MFGVWLMEGDPFFQNLLVHNANRAMAFLEPTKRNQTFQSTAHTGVIGLNSKRSSRKKAHKTGLQEAGPVNCSENCTLRGQMGSTSGLSKLLNLQGKQEDDHLHPKQEVWLCVQCASGFDRPTVPKLFQNPKHYI